MNTGDIIRNLRKNRKMTQTDLAKLINVSQQTITKWENNSAEPSGGAIKSLAKVFSVSSDYILGIENKNKTIEQALASVMSYDGKPMTNNDREILKGIIEAYLDNKLDNDANKKD